MDYGIGLSFLVTEATPYATIGWAYLAWRFVRAYERRAAQPDQITSLAGRVRLLEDALEQVEDRVNRSDELQRFTMRVLAGRESGESAGARR